MSETKNILETAHDIAQDVLVPRLKALETSMEALRFEVKLKSEAIQTEMRLTSAAIREEMKLTSQLLREEMKGRYDLLEQTIRQGNETHSTEIHALSEKMDERLQLRERIAAIEARMPRQ